MLSTRVKNCRWRKREIRGLIKETEKEEALELIAKKKRVNKREVERKKLGIETLFTLASGAVHVMWKKVDQ